MDFIQKIDIHFTQYISPYWVRQEPLLTVFRFLSLEGNWVIVWITLICIVCIWEIIIHQDKNRFARKVVPLLVSTVVFTLILGFVIHWGIKPIVGRLRPFATTNYPSMVCPHDYSFPSGHAAIATTLAAFMLFFDRNKKRRLLYISLAVLVSYSRIALQCHYFGDVVAGAGFGIVTAVLGVGLVRKYSSRSQDSSPHHKT